MNFLVKSLKLEQTLKILKLVTVTSETTFYVCNECEYCKSKDYNLCNHRKGIGTQVDGAFTNYVIAREESLHHIPDEVSYQSAAMTEPLACAHHGVSKIQVNSGDIAVVWGLGQSDYL